MPKTKSSPSSRTLVHALPELIEIKDDDMRNRVMDVYSRVMTMAGLEGLDELPFTTTFTTRIPYSTHVRAVTRMAIATGRCLAGLGIDIDMDILVAGALLHDVGKLLEYRAGKGRYSGPIIKHTFSGAAIAQEVGLPPEVIHCIIYHSYEGKGRRLSPEAILVHHCDFMHFEGARVHDTEPGSKNEHV